jgi:hypothetical protein
MLASFFIFTGCGIPTYFYLDESEFITSSTLNTLDNEINLEIALSASALVKIAEKGVEDGPGLKFFYVLSGNPTSYIVDNVTQLSTVSSSFNTNVKGGTGNGKPWSPGYSSAPGFYLYTDDSNKKNTFSFQKPEDTSQGLVIGTFSIRESPLEDLDFRKAPEMDLSLKNLALPIDFTIKRGVEDPEGYTNLLMQSTSGNLELQSYVKQKFPINPEALSNVITSEPVFLSHVENTHALYIHIWVALYAGKGAFNNIYWSNLRHLGYIKLM